MTFPISQLVSCITNVDTKSYSIDLAINQYMSDPDNQGVVKATLLDLQVTLDRMVFEKIAVKNELLEVARVTLGYVSIPATHNGLLKWHDGSNEREANTWARNAHALLLSIDPTRRDLPDMTQDLISADRDESTKKTKELAKHYVRVCTYIQNLQYASGAINDALDTLPSQRPQ